VGDGVAPPLGVSGDLGVRRRARVRARLLMLGGRARL
jgi:hypothetical protein